MSIPHDFNQAALEMFSKTREITRGLSLLEWVIVGFTHPPHSHTYLVKEKEKGTFAQKRCGGVAVQGRRKEMRACCV